jgi:hypothetical protein
MIQVIPLFLNKWHDEEEFHKIVGRELIGFLKKDPKSQVVFCNADKKRFNDWLFTNKLVDSQSQQIMWAINECYKLESPKYKELAEYLGISEQAVKQYNSQKRYLMLLGLAHHKNICDMKVAISEAKI